MAKHFRLRGSVRREGSEAPLVGVVVRAFDKDLVFDDSLGEARTDELGGFQIQFNDLDFRDALEQRPDVYLRVLSPNGEIELANTLSAVRHDARDEEHFVVLVPADVLAAAGL